MSHPLTDWRLSRAVSKGKMAKRLGLSWRQLHRIERGEAAPTLDTSLAIERETERAVTAEMLSDARQAHVGRLLVDSAEPDTDVDSAPSGAAA